MGLKNWRAILGNGGGGKTRLSRNVKRGYNRSESEGFPSLFAIVSWGAAATHWLSKVLNAHPDVLCLHNTHSHWARKSGSARVDDLTYMQIIHRAAQGYRLAGDCHGISGTSIARLRSQWKDRFRSAVVVRHPIPRLASAWNLATKTRFQYHELDHDRLRASAPSELRWLKSEGDFVFLHLAGMINSIQTDDKIGPIYKMEDLVVDQDQVRSLLRFLSAEQLDFDPALPEAVFRQELVSHSGKDAPRDPELVFQSLSGWQKEIFTAVFESRSRQIYESLGYDFSFL